MLSSRMSLCHVTRSTRPVKASVLDPFAVTTYQKCYTGTAALLPPIKYHQMPSLVHKGLTQQPARQFPIEPKGPVREVTRDPDGPVLRNMNIEKYLDPKPMLETSPDELVRPETPKPTITVPVRSLATALKPVEKERVFDTKFGKMDMATVNKLVNRVRWTSTTTDAGQEVGASIPVPEICPPETTLEPKADIVRLHGRKYEADTADWQKCVFWDCVQLRGTVTHDDLLEKTHGRPEKLLAKRKSRTDGYREQSERIRQRAQEKMLASVYVRQCPGYAGFTPREPPEGSMERNLEQAQMVSTMKATYRQLPTDVYKKQMNARKGPFSKTVTLTYPFNPYNKVVQRCVMTESRLK